MIDNKVMGIPVPIFTEYCLMTDKDSLDNSPDIDCLHALTARKIVAFREYPSRALR
jgi:hypothetical protein